MQLISTIFALGAAACRLFFFKIFNDKVKSQLVRSQANRIHEHVNEVHSAELAIRNFLKRGARSYNLLNSRKRGPKSLKMAFKCSFQSFPYKYFTNTIANIPPKGEGGRGGGWAALLNLPLAII